MVSGAQSHRRRLLCQLPKSDRGEKSPLSLIKGYIRLGAFIGDGAVIDYDFNTTDVCIVLPTEKIASRYKLHYDRK